MSLASEFKEFAMKGSVVDLAIGVIIGTAFGKIVSSLVSDVITPVLGKLIGDVNFTDLVITLGKNSAGVPVVIKYGTFLQTIFDFLVIAAVLFIALRGINALKKPAPAAADAPPPPPTRAEVLLTEIRDALVKK
jgi:large conductance mechanosensitive channel